jgi:hypothetical protein
MRTTIRMEEDLLKRAKAAAAESGMSLTAFIEDAVRRRLDGRDAALGRPELPVFHGNGLKQPIDIADGRALRAFLDEPYEDA